VSRPIAQRRRLVTACMTLLVLAVGIGLTTPARADAVPFVSTWNTTNVSTGSSAANQITLPLTTAGDYDFSVDWGDGSVQQVTASGSTGVTHTYATAGEKTISITGTIEGWRFANTGDRLKLLGIAAWGPLQLGNAGGYFHGAANMDITATDAPDLTGTTDLSTAFLGASTLNADLSGWNVSGVTSMRSTFQNASAFNGNINGWNVGSVRTMNSMFRGATAFNRDISGWSVTNVNDMASMFRGAAAFDQDLGDWDVSSVFDMANMLNGASLSLDNYDALLLGWARLTLEPGIDFHAGTSYYNPTVALASRGTLTDQYAWTITDAGAAAAPSTPAAPSAIAGAEVATVSWSAPADNHSAITSYTVAATPGSRTCTVDAPALSCEVTGLTNNTSYRFSVTATNAVGTSGASGLSSAVTPQTSQPSTPAKPFAAALDGAAQVWVARGSGGGIPVTYDITASPGPGTCTINAATATSCTISGLDNSTSYTFTATATNEFGTSGVSATSDAITPVIPFRTVWRTSNTGGSATDSRTVRLPLVSDGTYSFRVSWGDGTGGTITNANWSSARDHTYATAGDYVVTITGSIRGWNFNQHEICGWGGATDRNKLLEVSSWAGLRLDTPTWNTNYFCSAENLQITATDAPDLTGTTSLAGTFQGARTLNANLSGWNVSGVTNMQSMFQSATAFNGDLSGWNTANVTTMYAMFNGASAFNRDISSWSTGSVTTMAYMFQSATAFDQPLNGWNTANVTTMYAMFNNAARFNQPLNLWNTIKVTTMYAMFQSAAKFNQSLTGWDTGAVTTMNRMFNGATLFNGSVTGWNTANVTSMEYLFVNASSFNQSVEGWDTTKVTTFFGMFQSATSYNQPLELWGAKTAAVTTMANMFYNATAFNQPISTWNVAAVTDMSQMFQGATAFNRSLSAWSTGNVTSMLRMFYGATAFNGDITTWDIARVPSLVSVFENATSFNRDIGAWNTSRVTDMSSTFKGAAAFNQDLRAWDMGGVTLATTMFTGSALATANYNRMLYSWAYGSSSDGVTNGSGTGVVTDGVVFSGGSATYSIGLPMQARAVLVARGWSITDGGSTNADVPTPPLAVSQPATGTERVVTWTQPAARPSPATNPAITAYRVKAYSGIAPSLVDTGLGCTATAPDLTCTVTGLTDAGNYAFSVVAVNAIGDSDPSQMSVPAAPATPVAQSRFEAIKVGWFPQPTSGGDPLSYTVTADPGGATCTITVPDKTCVISGLSNAQPYTLTAIATNALGNSAVSSASAAVTPGNAFVSTWRTNNEGTSTPQQITLPIAVGGTYNFLVSWGDGTTTEVTSATQATHTYAARGDYDVTITGTLQGWRFANAGDRNKLVQIERWGPLRLGNAGGYFQGASRMVVTATDPIDLTGTTDLSNAFSGASLFNGAIGNWDTSAVTNMSNMFGSASRFNSDISGWQTGNVTNMSRMFFAAGAFNQPLAAWDVSKATDLSGMFYAASAFNQPLATWNTGNVTKLQDMFLGANRFNQPLSAWNTAKVTDMSRMFWAASAFDQDLNGWNTGLVTNMYGMFLQATAFDGAIGNWDTSSVTNMQQLFQQTPFNQPIGNWNTSNVTNMAYMFNANVVFNQSLGLWDTGKVTNMYQMFANATAFNQPLANWNTSSVTGSGFEQMFYGAVAFNGALTYWDVSKATNLRYFLYQARNFNQDLSRWNVANVTNFEYMFNGTSMRGDVSTWNVTSATNMQLMFWDITPPTAKSLLRGTPWYNKILIAWSKQNVKPNVSIHFGDTGRLYTYPKYSVGQSYPTVTAAAALARATLVSRTTGGKYWSITDGGSTNVDAPGVPSNVTFTRTGATQNGSQATITWERPTDGDLVTPMTYEVVSTRDPTRFFCNTANLTCTITGLPVDDRATSFHQFTVRGVNTIGDSDWSTPLPAVSTPALPQPQFGTVTPTEYGFTVPITNFTDVYDWSGTATQGSVEVSASGLVTVGSALTPVNPDTTSTATITAGRFGYADQSSTVGSRALKQKLVPSLGPIVRTPGGFTATIDNFDAVYTWTPTLSGAGTVTVATVGALKVLTVTGLADGAVATATLTTTRTGYAAGVQAVTGNALDPALNPTFGPVTPTGTGFQAVITNYDAAYGWAPSASPTGSAALVTEGDTTSIVVTGVAPDTETTATLGTTRSGYLAGTATLTARSYKAALVFSLGTPVPTDDGYTVPITGYSTVGWAWSGTVTADGTAIPGGAVSFNAGIATVTGLSPATTALLTITASQDGHAPASQTATATSLNAAYVPTIATPIRTPDGFTAVITNYLAGDYAWSVAKTAGTATIETTTVDSVTVHRVVVTGLLANNPSIVTLRTVRSGYADGVIEFTESSLRAKLDPTFGSVTRLTGGFSVPITNYDGATYNPEDYGWTASTNRDVPVAAAIDPVTGVVTVSGLADGVDATLTVANTRTEYAPGSSQITGTALAAALTPTLGTPTPGDRQVTLPITNFDGTVGHPTDYTWGASTNGGSGVLASVSAVTGLVTVTGLAHGQSVLVTVTATRTGYRTGSAATTIAALEAPLTPDLGVPEPISGGFRVTIANYPTGTNATDYGWSVSHNGGSGVAVTPISADGVIDVTGLGLADVVRLTVQTTKAGHVSGSAWVDGSPQQPALTPTFGDVTRVAGGFQVTIANYLANKALYAFAATTDGGETVTVDLATATGVVTVGGLADNQLVTLTITTTRSGYAQGSAGAPGRALATALTPTFGDPVAGDGGFTVAIANYDANFTWGVETTAGSIARVGAGLTVSGLSVGQSATVTVTTLRTGYLPGSAQATSQALQAALTPTLGPVERLDGGFRRAITNYDAAFTWTLTPSSGAAIVELDPTSHVLEVTGLADGASTTVAVGTSRAGYFGGSTDATGSALDAKRDPTFATATAGTDSFTVQITNYLAAYTWTPRIIAGSGSAEISGTGLLTVSGLGTGGSATVAVDVTRDGYLPGTASVTGRAKQAALTPSFGTLAQQLTGFTAEIVNYDAAFAWPVSTTAGSVSIVDDGGRKLLTVTGLARGERATVTIGTTRTGFFDGTTTLSGRAVLPALTPSFGTAVRGVHGFTVPITNYDADYDWELTPSQGAAEIVVAGSTATLTVTGLTDGQPATVTVTVDDPSPQVPSILRTDTASGSALSAALHPTFGTVVRGSLSFTVQITNYDADYDWTPSVTHGSVVISGTGLVTVSALTAEQSATLTVTTGRTGYRGGTGDVAGQALAAPLTPLFGAVERLDGGFRVPITNYDAAFTWTLTPSTGATIVAGALEVTGLADNASSTVLVTTSRTGYVGSSDSVTGIALDTELAPTFGTPVPGDGGFTVQVTNFSGDYDWSASSTAGSASISGTGLVTVTGLSVGQTATVTIGTTRDGYIPGSAEASGRSLQAALTPAFGSVTPTTTGFTVQITNYDAAFTWAPTLAPVAGSVSISGTGLMTVTDLTLGDRSTVTVGTTRSGYFAGSNTVAGRAVLPALTATFDPVVRGANGFTAVITNYDADYTWALARTAGTAEIVDVAGTKVLTVTGLTDGEASEVTISVDDPTPQTPTILTTTTVESSALDAARVPMFGMPVPGDGQFAVQVTNYDGVFTWNATTTAGSAAIDSSGLVTVTGLGVGEEATVTVTATRIGYLSGAAPLAGRSLQAARTPAFGAVERRQGGFAVEITNYDAAFVWAPTTTAGAVSIVEVVVAGPRTAQMLTVTGLTDGQSATATLGTTQDGFFPGTADVTEAALAAALLTPTLGAPVPLRMSFRVPITNYDAGYTWSATTDVGSARVIDVAGDKFAEVYGIGPLQEATVTVHASLPGHLDGLASVLGAADVGGQLDPGFAAPVQTADGFTADLTNYDADYAWSVSSTVGTAQVVLQGAQWRLVVTGVDPDTAVSATVGTTRPRYDPGSTTIASSSLKTALAPRLAAAVPVSGGFVADVLAYNARFTWSVTSSAGSATITGQGVVQVTGLPVGGTATITVRSTRTGYVQGAEQATAAALGAAINPAFAGIASTTSEATATIANYDPAYAWAVTADQGSASIGAGGVVRVQGLVPGTGVSVTVRSTRAGFESGAGSFTTNAQPLPRGIVAATVPGRPQITGITKGPRRSIAVKWKAGGDGGSPILTARVSCKADAHTVATQDDEPVLKLLRLKKGKKYSCQLTVTNVVGVSTKSKVVTHTVS